MAITKTIYLFDQNTGALIGPCEAQESPREPGKFIEPTFSTELVPPAAGANQIAVFSAGAWSLQSDYRGKMIYDQATGVSQEVTALGPLPAGFSLSPAPLTLPQAVAIANDAIDEAAGACRAKYITTTQGQSETYMAKGNDAAAYKAAGYPVANIAGFPWVQAEGQARYGATPTAANYQAAADLIIATASSWRAKGAAIEQARIAGKVAIAAAIDVAGVEAAQAAAVAVLAAL